jgi:hypothetical protein
MSELADLTELCRRWGATSNQAEIMARQLTKRADQLAAERGQSRVEVMAYLLRLVGQAREGKVPVEFHSPGTVIGPQNSPVNPAK